MKKTILLLLSFFAITCSTWAQTTHEIEAGGGPNGPTPYFAPQFITIQVGDIVHWQSVGGTHNVDGRLSTFPDNPAGFYSGSAATGLNFSFTFAIPGIYDFECGAFDHALTQFGTITVVEGPNSLTEVNSIDVQFGPNPAGDFLNINAETPIVNFEIVDLNGRIIERVIMSEELHKTQLDVSMLEIGIYVLRLETKAGIGLIRFSKE